MLRLKLHKLLKDRQMTAYQLAQQAGMDVRTAYRYAEEGAVIERIEAKNLGKICEALDCQPGDILEWVSEPKRKRGR